MRLFELVKLMAHAFGLPGSSPPVSVEDDKPWDPENPFPEVVAIEFRDVLDLHSIPPRQVRAVVEDYIAEAHQIGVRWVRIIHGKGTGVQREIVRSILAVSTHVVEYKDAPPEAGGWGATVVILRVEPNHRTPEES
ncbi:MAG: Smr/MutS family protein [Blastocatellia bacterium]